MSEGGGTSPPTPVVHDEGAQVSSPVPPSSSTPPTPSTPSTSNSNFTVPPTTNIPPVGATPSSTVVSGHAKKPSNGENTALKRRSTGQEKRLSKRNSQQGLSLPKSLPIRAPRQNPNKSESRLSTTSATSGGSVSAIADDDGDDPMALELARAIAQAVEEGEAVSDLDKALLNPSNPIPSINLPHSTTKELPPLSTYDTYADVFGDVTPVLLFFAFASLVIADNISTRLGATLVLADIASSWSSLDLPFLTVLATLGILASYSVISSYLKAVKTDTRRHSIMPQDHDPESRGESFFRGYERMDQYLTISNRANLHSIMAHHFLPGEQLVWADSPLVRESLGSAIKSVLVLLLYGPGLVVYLNVMATPAEGLPEGVWFNAFIAGNVVIGTYLFQAYNLAAWMSTMYLITTHRAVIVGGSIWGLNVRAYTWAALAPLGMAFYDLDDPRKKKKDPKRAGTLVFFTGPQPTGPGMERSTDAFPHVAHVEKVGKTMNRLFRRFDSGFGSRSNSMVSAHAPRFFQPSPQKKRRSRKGGPIFGADPGFKKSLSRSATPKASRSATPKAKDRPETGHHDAESIPMTPPTTPA